MLSKLFRGSDIERTHTSYYYHYKKSKYSEIDSIYPIGALDKDDVHRIYSPGTGFDCALETAIETILSAARHL